MGIGPLLGGIGGLVAGGSSLLSGLFGGGGSSGAMASAIRDAGRYQLQAAQKAIEEQQQELAQARQYMQPFYQAAVGPGGAGGTAGGGALRQYQNMLGLGTPGFDPTAALQATPGYQWMLGQGVNAMDRSAASRGLLKSGAQYKGLMDFGQNLGITKAYDPYMSRLQGLIGGGQNAAALQGGYGMQAAGSIGNYLTQAGQAQANTAEQLAMANLLGSQQNWNRTMGGLGIMTGTLSNPQFTNALGSLWGGGSTPFNQSGANALNLYGQTTGYFS